MATKTSTKKRVRKDVGNKTDKILQVNLRNVKLSKESRKLCRKVKDCLWGNVANAIECGNWWIPVKNHNYTHMKSEFEKGMREFYDLDFDVTIADFDTDIICYDNHYPTH